MTLDAVQILGTTVPALGAGLIGWATYRLNRRRATTDAAQQLFNEVQEERGELKKDRTELRERIERIEVDNRARDERERIRDDYIQELRNHIRLALPPPPPDWPEGLRRL